MNRLEEKQIQKFIEKYVEEKIKIDSNYIRCSFYDIRVKNNFSEEETLIFLKLIRNYLENSDFNVYFTGAKFIYKELNRIVQSNELFIAYK